MGKAGFVLRWPRGRRGSRNRRISGAAAGAALAAVSWGASVVPLQEAEVIQAIRLLTRFGQAQQDSSLKEEDLHKELTEVDPNTRLNLAATARQPVSAGQFRGSGRIHAPADEGG